MKQLIKAMTAVALPECATGADDCNNICALSVSKSL